MKSPDFFFSLYEGIWVFAKLKKRAGLYGDLI